MTGPDLAIAMRLLDAAKRQGFVCQQVGSGEDAPLLCTRERDEYRDTILIDGFDQGCHAIRQRNSRLIIAGDDRTVYEIEGSALSVLNTVLTWP